MALYAESEKETNCLSDERLLSPSTAVHCAEIGVVLTIVSALACAEGGRREDAPTAMKGWMDRL